MNHKRKTLSCYAIFLQCWRFLFFFNRKCAGHFFFQAIPLGRSCCTDSQVSVSLWCCTMPCQEAMLIISCLFPRIHYAFLGAEWKKRTHLDLKPWK